mgnify:CR=1 FL=1
MNHIVFPAPCEASSRHLSMLSASSSHFLQRTISLVIQTYTKLLQLFSYVEETYLSTFGKQNMIHVAPSTDLNSAEMRSTSFALLPQTPLNMFTVSTNAIESPSSCSNSIYNWDKRGWTGHRIYPNSTYNCSRRGD